MIEFKLPSLGADMDEGTLLAWHVKPGDAVKRGQVVAVVDTSKAAVDVEIWHEGVVHELLVQVGRKGAGGHRAGHAAGAGRSGASSLLRQPAPEPRLPKPLRQLQPAAPPVVPRVLQPSGKLAARTRHPVSPSARRRAKELGIDPDTLAGTGAQGSVTLADIEAAQRTPAQAVRRRRQRSRSLPRHPIASRKCARRLPPP